MARLLAVGALLAPASAAGCGFEPTRLRVNNLENPLGTPLDGKTVFSWGLVATASPPPKGAVQSAYRIECSSKGAGGAADLWDSGKVESSESLQVPYGGKALKPSQLVHWKVSVWSGAEACGAASGTFETALAAGEAGWAGSEWLARFPQSPLNATSCDLYDDESERNEAPRFRSEVSVPATITAARAYIVGLGYYQLFVDGKRIGTSRLDPGWTTYDKTVLYAVHDVTAELTSGKHAVGVELGNGWWNPMTLKMWGATDVRKALTTSQGRGNGTTTEPMFRLKVVATMSDGTQKTILSSSTQTGAWLAGGSPTTFNNIYLGEHYDARKEDPAGPSAWSMPGFDASSWTKAVVAGSPSTLSLGALSPQSVPPIRRQGILSTTVVSKAIPTAPGSANSTIVLDTGKNHAGVCRFRLQGKAGDKIVMRYVRHDACTCRTVACSISVPTSLTRIALARGNCCRRTANLSTRRQASPVRSKARPRTPASRTPAGASALGGTSPSNPTR